MIGQILLRHQEFRILGLGHLVQVVLQQLQYHLLVWDLMEATLVQRMLQLQFHYLVILVIAQQLHLVDMVNLTTMVNYFILYTLKWTEL